MTETARLWRECVVEMLDAITVDVTARLGEGAALRAQVALASEPAEIEALRPALLLRIGERFDR